MLVGDPPVLPGPPIPEMSPACPARPCATTVETIVMLQRLARCCYRRRRYVLAAWLVALVLVAFLSKTAGGKDTTKFTLPGTESQQAVDLLKARFPARSGDTADIVFAAPGTGGVDRI